MGVKRLSAEGIVAKLRELAPELRAAGISRLSVFGSSARRVADPDSDIDIAAEFETAAEIGLLEIAALERRLTELLGRPVQLLPEPVEKQRLQANIDRDRRRAF